MEQTNVTPVKKKRETIASTKKRVRDTGVEATVRKTARKTKKEQELEEDSNNAEEEEQEPTKTPKRNSKLEKTASSRTVESTAPKLGRSTRKR